MTSFIGIILPTLFEIIFMKLKLHPNLVVLMFSLLLISCGEDDPQPLQSEVQAVLLAGVKGSSKTWRVTEIDYQRGTTPVQNYTFDPCFLDNVFTFKNNDAQDYEATEGATKCDSTDPDVIESGVWTFTTDGKMIIVLPDNLTYSYNVLFAFLTYPSTVVELTDTSLKIRMSLVDDGINEVYNVTFVKN